MSATTSIEIECERLFDGRNLAENAKVLVEDGRIVAVDTIAAGDRAGGELSSASERRRARFVMPGLIDAHVHNTGYVEGLPAGVPFQPMKHFARLCIFNGVTTVRDTGNSLETLFYLREWNDRYNGPRLFGSGPLLDAPPLTWPFSRIVRSAQDAEREVGRLAYEGVDLIKAYRHITPELLDAVVGAADAHGLPVAVDSRLSSAEQVSTAGARSIEHIANVRPDHVPVEDEGASDGVVAMARDWSDVDPTSDGAVKLADTLVRQGTFVVPTLTVLRRWSLIDEMINDPHLDFMVPVMPYHKYLKNLRGPVGKVVGRRYMNRYLPIPWLKGEDRARVERGLDNMAAMLRLLHERGVRIAAGTDSPNPSVVPGFSLHQEMAEMAHSGLPPAAVLSAATAGAAELIGQADLGTVRPGAHADLLLLDGDPSERIQDIRNIEAVMKGGEIIDREHVRGKLLEEMERVKDPQA